MKKLETKKESKIINTCLIIFTVGQIILICLVFVLFISLFIDYYKSKNENKLPIITYNLVTINDSLRIEDINSKDSIIKGNKYQRNIILYNKEIIYDTIIYNGNLVPLFK